MDERSKYIFEQLNLHYQAAKTLGYEIFALCVQGSQNYGLDIYTEDYKSDIDTKMIIIPTLDDIVNNRQPISTTYYVRDGKIVYNEEEQVGAEHIDVKDIRVMFENFKKQNINFVEILFTDFYIVPDRYIELWEELRSMAEEVTHAHPHQTVRTMSGMSMEKFKALKHPYPSINWKIEKWGYDGKQLHHIIRINDFIKRYISGMSFKEAMTPTHNIKEMLIAAKLNAYNLGRAEELAKKYDDETKVIKDDFISRTEEWVEVPTYNKLDSVKTRAIKKFFLEELRNESGKI